MALAPHRQKEIAAATKDALAQRIQFPEKLLPLLEREDRKRNYVAHGGRGSAKSWSFARAQIVQMMLDPLRILNAREVMRTIDESVHELLCNQIELLNMGDYFKVFDKRIESRVNDASVVYEGLRSLNVNNVRSYEGVDLLWVEEAHTVRKASWNIVIPTIRAERSEIWVTFNADLDTDDTYIRFVEEADDDTFLVKMTYRDNPWFPEVLEKERVKLLRLDPVEYDNIWEGNPRAVVAGAIYAKELTELVQSRRYGRVPYDPSLPVHRIWDLGWNDAMSIILVQKLHQACMIIGYEEESFKRYDEWLAYFEKGKYANYRWGQDWLPHDGDQHNPQTGKSPKKWLTGLGCKHVHTAKKLDREDGIKAARMLFPRTYIDRTNASGLKNSLSRYRRAVPQSTDEPGAPVHDEASHGADAYRLLATVVAKIDNEVVGIRSSTTKHVPFVPHDAGAGY